MAVKPGTWLKFRSLERTFNEIVHSEVNWVTACVIVDGYNVGLH